MSEQPTRKPGRPKGSCKPERKSVQLPPIWIEEELAEWLDAEMVRQRRSRSDLVRYLLWQARERSA